MAANYPGERNVYYNRSEGHKLVCTPGAQARPVVLDGKISTDFAGN